MDGGFLGCSLGRETNTGQSFKQFTTFYHLLWLSRYPETKHMVAMMGPLCPLQWRSCTTPIRNTSRVREAYGKLVELVPNSLKIIEILITWYRDGTGITIYSNFPYLVKQQWNHLPILHHCAQSPYYDIPLSLGQHLHRRSEIRRARFRSPMESPEHALGPRGKSKISIYGWFKTWIT